MSERHREDRQTGGQTDEKIEIQTKRQINRFGDRQTERDRQGLPVVGGGMGEEGHVRGELAPEPEDGEKNKKTDDHHKHG